MNFVKVFTPRDTEELKPGLFIQTRHRNIKDKKGNVVGKKVNSYRQINPICWNGKFRKEQLKTIFRFRTLFFIIAVILFWYAIGHEYKTYSDFYATVVSDPEGFCDSIYSPSNNVDGKYIINLTEVLNEKREDTNTLQDTLE